MAAPRIGRQVMAPRRRHGRFTRDDAFVGLFIGAMEANGHVSPDEAARAQHILLSMKRFRRKSGDALGRMIGRARADVDARGASATVATAVRALPGSLRPAAFALVADLVLVDGTVDRDEQRFLADLARELRLSAELRDGLLGAMRVKNSA